MLRRIFGSKNDREIKRMRNIVAAINQLEAPLEQYSDEQIEDQKVVFEARLDQGETLEQILPEAFALVREAGKRALGMRIFDVQLIGGITLHEGRIAEMRTGEGKTLVATLPLYLNALQGNVHLVTVNDYLAKWGAEWMTPLYQAVGMRVGVVYAGQDPAEKKNAYKADVDMEQITSSARLLRIIWLFNGGEGTRQPITPSLMRLTLFSSMKRGPH